MAHMEMPTLKLSQKVIDFTMIVQLQNMDPIQIQYKFISPKIVLEKEPIKSYKTVFPPVPSKGTLPSHNIEIQFAPNEEMQYLLDVPIAITQNKFKTILQVKGFEMKIVLTFDPPIIKILLVCHFR